MLIYQINRNLKKKDNKKLVKDRSNSKNKIKMIKQLV